jgi:hypothetical protein
MFKNKEQVVRHVVELSDESKQALAALDSDVQGLEALLADMLGSMRKIQAQLAGEILAPDNYEDGVTVFETAAEAEAAGRPQDYQRQRSSPFNRRPRGEQVAWLLSIMEPGRWYNADEVAREYANDYRELRYLRQAVGGRFREMTEEGLVSRQAAQTRGVMYEYGLTPAGVEAKKKAVK